VNIKGGFYIDDTELIYISELDHRRLSNSALKVNDLILSKVGNSIGYFARVDEVVDECNISENNIGIKLHTMPDIRKHYILTYLNTYYANRLVLRRRSGNAQPKLNVGDLTYIPIPLFSTDLESKISELIIQAKDAINQSKSIYTASEDVLLNELQLLNWHIPSKTCSVKRLSESFIKSTRLDAEYYQPKYDELFDKLKTFETKLLSEIVDIKKSIEPGSDAYQTSGIPFIRVADLSKFGLTNTDTYLSRDEYDGVIRPKKDTILLSKDGSVGIAYKIEEDTDVITSGAILHLIIKDDSIRPDYITLVLNSIVVKMQAERDAGGSVIQHWKPSEIEKVVIPILDNEVQVQISEKVQESFALRRESARLLELAKTAVEVAIEQGEDKAMELLTQNM
jgi:restriction endonuclease S subunit